MPRTKKNKNGKVRNRRNSHGDGDGGRNGKKTPFASTGVVYSRTLIHVGGPNGVESVHEDNDKHNMLLSGQSPIIQGDIAMPSHLREWHSIAYQLFKEHIGTSEESKLLTPSGHKTIEDIRETIAENIRESRFVGFVAKWCDPYAQTSNRFVCNDAVEVAITAQRSPDQDEDGDSLWTCSVFYKVQLAEYRGGACKCNMEFADAADHAEIHGVPQRGRFVPTPRIPARILNKMHTTAPIFTKFATGDLPLSMSRMLHEARAPDTLNASCDSFSVPWQFAQRVSRQAYDSHADMRRLHRSEKMDPREVRKIIARLKGRFDAERAMRRRMGKSHCLASGPILHVCRVKGVTAEQLAATIFSSISAFESTCAIQWGSDEHHDTFPETGEVHPDVVILPLRTGIEYSTNTWYSLRETSTTFGSDEYSDIAEFEEFVDVLSGEFEKLNTSRGHGGGASEKFDTSHGRGSSVFEVPPRTTMRPLQLFEVGVSLAADYDSYERTSSWDRRSDRGIPTGTLDTAEMKDEGVMASIKNDPGVGSLAMLLQGNYVVPFRVLSDLWPWGASHAPPYVLLR